MASGGERGGCLTALFRLVGIKIAGQGEVGEALPYRCRDDFLSAAERSFYGVLFSTVAGKAVVFAKVRIADLLYVPRGEGSLAWQNRISAKHVDFVLCDPATLQPLAALELDDASHARQDRRERDDFLDAALKAAGLPLLRFPARRQYDPGQLKDALTPVLDRTVNLNTVTANTGTANTVQQAGNSGESPRCPKCGDEMLLRTASKGGNRGQQFFGCRNYPQCRGMLPGA